MLDLLPLDPSPYCSVVIYDVDAHVLVKRKRMECGGWHVAGRIVRGIIFSSHGSMNDFLTENVRMVAEQETRFSGWLCIGYPRDLWAHPGFFFFFFLQAYHCRLIIMLIVAVILLMKEGSGWSVFLCCVLLLLQVRYLGLSLFPTANYSIHLRFLPSVKAATMNELFLLFLTPGKPSFALVCFVRISHACREWKCNKHKEAWWLWQPFYQWCGSRSTPLEYNIYKTWAGGHLSRRLDRSQHPLLLLSHP